MKKSSYQAPSQQHVAGVYFFTYGIKQIFVLQLVYSVINWEKKMFGYSLANVSSSGALILIIVLIGIFIKRSWRKKGPYDDFYGEVDDRHPYRKH